MNVDFSFCLIFNKEAQFLYNRADIFMKHKLLPVQLVFHEKICSVIEKLSFIIEVYFGNQKDSWR